MRYISKSKIKQNKQCAKLLWLEVNRPKLKNYSDATLKTFTRGRDVETIAKDQFPKAKEVKAIKHVDKLKQTENFLKTEDTIFEASFVGNDVFIQVDILNKFDNESYDVIEIKSGMSISPEYLDDVIIQYFAIVDSKRIKINRYYIWVVSRTATSETDLFNKVDVTEQLIEKRDYYEKMVQEAKSTAEQLAEPKVTIGPHCNKPYECPFIEYCWKKNIGNPKSVLNLPKFNAKWKAFNAGISSIDDELFLKNYSYHIDQKLIYDSIKSSKLIMEKDKIKKSLSEWVFPLHFFDFETFMSAVPILDKQRPYQQVVFQYSLHKLDKDHSISHYEYLHNSKVNPDLAIAQSMKEFFSPKGSIVTYNKTFEITRIKELAAKEELKEYKEFLESLIPRIVDLLDVVEEFVYHPRFMGSFSLKIVSPTLLGAENGGYTDSEIKSGSEVADVFLRYISSQDETEKESIKKALLLYNKYDTLNLVLLYLWLLDQKVDLPKKIAEYMASQSVSFNV